MTIPDDSKRCYKCESVKPRTAFHRCKTNPDGLQYHCKECANGFANEYWARKGKEFRKKYNEKYKGKMKVSRRKSNFKRQYGISPEIYLAMFAAQGNCCSICKGTESRTRWKSEFAFHVDHCHKTGKVRGIICSKCNVGLGISGDTLESVLRMVEYLRRAEEDTFSEGSGI